MSPLGRRKRYGLYVLAIMIMLSGAAALLFEWNSFARGGIDFLIWSLGLLMIVIGTRLVRMSNGRVATDSMASEDQRRRSGESRRPGARLWLLGAAVLVALATSYHYLLKTALGGYHQLWPVYVFAALSLIFLIMTGYLFLRMR